MARAVGAEATGTRARMVVVARPEATSLWAAVARRMEPIGTGAITAITVTPALAGPDGVRALDAHTLLVVEGAANRLAKVTVAATTATSVEVAGDLDMPTAVVVARGSAWVTEGQLGRLFAQPSQAPNLPFAIRRVAL